jgi:hypothetical protein
VKKGKGVVGEEDVVVRIPAKYDVWCVLFKDVTFPWREWFDFWQTLFFWWIGNK